MTIRPDPSRTARVYLGVFGLLVLADLLTWFGELAGYASQGGLRMLFDLNREANVPATCAALSLLVCGGLMALTARHHRELRSPDAGRWTLLAAAFVFLALDESAGFHEILGVNLARLDPDGVGGYLWVVPYGLAAAAVGLWSLPMLLRLERRWRGRLLAAGCVYVAGALGMEVVAAVIKRVGLSGSVYHDLSVIVEESLEFAGVGILLWTLVAYLAHLDVAATIRFTAAPAAATQTPAIAPSPAGAALSLDPHAED